MSRRADKRLARVLTRMLEDRLFLVAQEDGSWAAFSKGRVCARLSRREARHALSSGLVYETGAAQLVAGAEARHWLARRQQEDSGFAAQHQDIQCVSLIDTDGDLYQARINTAQSPLAWLMRPHGSAKSAFLSTAEFAAGERLRRDYERSSLSQKLCADWLTPANASGRSGPRNAVLDAADSALAAKDRFMNALSALGPGLDDLVFGICIREYSLQALEKSRHWPRRSAKVVLKLALARLAQHYGLTL